MIDYANSGPFALSPTASTGFLENLHQKRIPKLDFLRAISALTVALYHFGISIPGLDGVMVFFVISGFLITWLLLSEWDKYGTVSLKDFYIRRTFRIFPAFYAFWAVTVGLLLAKHGHIIWGQVAATFFYVGNYYQGLNHYPETGLSHAWSLGVEEQYYLIWPLMFLLLAGNRKRLMWATCASIVLVWVYRAALQTAGVSEPYLHTAFETRVDHLLVGCALAISLHSGYFTRFWKAACARTWYMILPVAAFVLSSASGFGLAYRYYVGYAIEPLFLAIIMAQLMLSKDRRLAWMDSALVVFLGSISYSTYLYHKLAGTIAQRALASLGSPAVSLVAALVITYLVASLSYYGIEKPFLSLRDRFMHPRRRKAKSAVIPKSVAASLY